jgi:hypothetical protein
MAADPAGMVVGATEVTVAGAGVLVVVPVEVVDEAAFEGEQDPEGQQGKPNSFSWSGKSK